MPNPTIRVSERSHQLLKELWAKTGQSMQTVIDEAVEEYRRQAFIREANASYGRVRRDKGKWNALQGELDSWDDTLMDGVLGEEQPRRRQRRAK